MNWRNNTLDNLYFEWLYGQVGDVDEIDLRKSYWNLMRALYSIEFRYFIPNDDNRAVDGMELREEFKYEHEVDDSHWDFLPCSVLEMLVALARRMEFADGGSVEDCFWMFIRHMGLDSQDDTHALVEVQPPATWASDRLMDRQYEYDGGYGGLFPLKHPSENQRHVELYFQMSEYIREEVQWTSTQYQ